MTFYFCLVMGLGFLGACGYGIIKILYNIIRDNNEKFEVVE